MPLWYKNHRTHKKRLREKNNLSWICCCPYVTDPAYFTSGNTVSNMGHSIFNQSFLDSRSHGGFLYIRSTFQCTNKLLLPPSPFLFAILLQKWETPWAKVFPIRLMLRLGAEFRCELGMDVSVPKVFSYVFVLEFFCLCHICVPEDPIYLLWLSKDYTAVLDNNSNCICNLL